MVLQKKFWAVGIMLLCLFLVFAGVMYLERPASADEKLVFTEQAAAMRVGEAREFAVNHEGAAWTSSNKNVADFSENGRLVARRTGRTKITAAAAGQSVSMIVQVKTKFTVGIDPGHQGCCNADVEPNGPGSSVMRTKATDGTHGVSTGKPEYQLNLEIAEKLKEELEKRGYRVVLTRSDNDVDISNAHRAKKLNQRCDISIRLHADGGESSVRGAMAIYPSEENEFVGNLSAASERLSDAVLDSYCATTGMSSRGTIERDDLSGLNWSTIPVTFLEMGFMTNVLDDEYMSSAHGQKNMVKGIANGVDQYFR